MCICIGRVCMDKETRPLDPCEVRGRCEVFESSTACGVFPDATDEDVIYILYGFKGGKTHYLDAAVFAGEPSLKSITGFYPRCADMFMEGGLMVFSYFKRSGSILSTLALDGNVDGGREEAARAARRLAELYRRAGAAGVRVIDLSSLEARGDTLYDDGVIKIVRKELVIAPTYRLYISYEI